MAIFSEVTEAFESMLQMEDEICETALSVLERFVVLLYDQTSDLLQVNNARNSCSQRSLGPWRTYPHNTFSTQRAC